MRVLIDQNISFRIIARLETHFSNISHVKDHDLVDASDVVIFKYAKENDIIAILTLDEDFDNIQLVHKSPPKIIRLRIGNSTITEQAAVLIAKYSIIERFLSQEDQDYLEIFR